MMIAHLFLFVLLAQPSPHRGATVRRESQRTHPCPSTDLMRGACSGYVKDHVIPLACGGPDSNRKCAVAVRIRWAGQRQMGTYRL